MALLIMGALAGTAFGQAAQPQDAQEPPSYGSSVGRGDGDLAPVLTGPEEGASVCARSQSSSSTYRLGDPVYLAVGTSDCATTPGTVQRDWIRLTPVADHPAGSRVRSFDDDHGEPVFRVFDLQNPQVPLLWYYDANDNDAFDTGDTAYLSADDRVHRSDVRLNPFGQRPGGEQIDQAGDLNLRLKPWHTPIIHDALRYLDTDGLRGFTGQDVPYLVGANTPSAQPAVPQVHSLRLGTYTQEHTAFERVGPSDPDMVAVLSDRFTVAGDRHRGSICIVPQQDGTTYLPGDPVYFVPGTTDCRGGGRIEEHDLRLSGEQAGTKVRHGDPDRRMAPLIQLDRDGPAGTKFLRYLDNQPFGALNEPDTLYLVTAADRDTVRPGDIRLTAYQDQPAGSHVLAQHSDTNLPLAAMPGGEHIRLFAYHDENGDGRFNWDDTPHIRLDPEEPRLLHNQVRLDATGGLTHIGESGVTTRLRLLRGAEAASAICVVDMEGTGTYNPGDPVVLRREGDCTGSSSFFDLRLTTTPHGDAGTLLRFGDGDWNLPLVAFGNRACLDRLEQAGGPFAATNAVYLTRCNQRLEAGDIRFTSYGPHGVGSVVRTGESDHRLALHDGEEATQSARTWSIKSAFYYLDLHSTGHLGADDVVYLVHHHPADSSAPESTSPQPNTIRLSPAHHLRIATIAPGAVQGLTAQPGQKQVHLDWQPPASGGLVREYLVEWGTEPGDLNETVVVTENTATITSLPDNVQHHFTVRARNEAGTGPGVPEVSATPGVAGQTEPPGAPRGLGGAMLDDARLELQWDPPESGGAVREYRVRAGTASGGPYPFEWTVSEPPLVVEGLEPGHHFFVVHAGNAAGEGPASDEFTVELSTQGRDVPGGTLSILLALPLALMVVRSFLHHPPARL